MEKRIGSGYGEKIIHSHPVDIPNIYSAAWRNIGFDPRSLQPGAGSAIMNEKSTNKLEAGR